MDKVSYLSIMEKADDGYSVYFPDLPGCISTGKDLQDVRIISDKRNRSASQNGMASVFLL